MLRLYTDASVTTGVSKHLQAAALSEEQRKHVLAALDAALTDAFYTLLLSLDGAASLSGEQHQFNLTDEAGNLIANGDGSLEEAAWSTFQGSAV
ncbi:hypothetical protein [Sphingomonas sp.]